MNKSEAAWGGVTRGEDAGPWSGQALLFNPFSAPQVYPSNSGDDYSRDPAGYTPSKPPSTVYPGAFYMAGELLTTPAGIAQHVRWRELGAGVHETRSSPEMAPICSAGDAQRRQDAMGTDAAPQPGLTCRHVGSVSAPLSPGFPSRRAP